MIPTFVPLVIFLILCCCLFVFYLIHAIVLLIYLFNCVCIAQLTGNDLLSLVIPLLTQDPDFTESSTQSDTRTYPRTITHWAEFDAECLNFHALDAFVLTNPLIQLDPDSLSVTRELHMEALFVTAFALNLSKLKTHIGRIDKTSVCTLDSKIGHYDIACWANERIFAVGELKTFWNLPNRLDDAMIIHDLFVHSRVHDYEHRDLHCKWWQAIAQLYGYMIDQNVKYGFLSCFNRTWFVKADINDTIRISNAVHCNSGKCMRAFAYFMYCARSDVNGALTINNRRYSYSDESGAEEDDDDSDVDHSSAESSDVEKTVKAKKEN